ncbi:MAG TPA: hypothetical protein VF520_11505 [Thermoleophilaceae bacterium]|jgi:hypothetical protein
MRSHAPTIALAATVAVALAALAAAAATDDRHLAFALGVPSKQVVAVIGPGHWACQRGIDAEADFDEVALAYGTFHRPGPRLELFVLDATTGRVLSDGALPAGYADNAEATARLRKPVRRSAGSIDVCAGNVGAGPVAIYGGAPTDAFPSDGTFDGHPAAGDLRMTFRRSDPRSALSRLPDVMRRAAVLRPDPVGPWTFWALLALLVLAVPALLAAALRSATGRA